MDYPILGFKQNHVRFVMEHGMQLWSKQTQSY